jgi:hypothetical protein
MTRSSILKKRQKTYLMKNGRKSYNKWNHHSNNKIKYLKNNLKTLDRIFTAKMSANWSKSMKTAYCYHPMNTWIANTYLITWSNSKDSFTLIQRPPSHQVSNSKNWFNDRKNSWIIKTFSSSMKIIIKGITTGRKWLKKDSIMQLFLKFLKRTKMSAFLES